MIKRLLVLSVALLLGAAACNDDGGGGNGSGGTGSGGDGGGQDADGGLSDEEQDYLDRAMQDFDAEDAAPLTRDDAECMVTRMVQDLGVDRLDEIGLTAESFAEDEDLPEDLSEDDARRVLRSMERCFDVRDLFLAGLEESGDVPEEARQCIAEQLDDDFIQKVMLALLTEGEEAMASDPELTSEMVSLFTECQGAAG